ncbi:hypothetical protein VZH09_04365 [Synechococcus elongatus IITB7]
MANSETSDRAALQSHYAVPLEFAWQGSDRASQGLGLSQSFAIARDG